MIMFFVPIIAAVILGVVAATFSRGLALAFTGLLHFVMGAK
jgi:hypothetical protein